MTPGPAPAAAGARCATARAGSRQAARGTGRSDGSRRLADLSPVSERCERISVTGLREAPTERSEGVR